MVKKDGAAGAAALTSEMLWNIANGVEECADRKLRLAARRHSSLVMRSQGASYRDIAAHFGVDVKTAFADVKRELDARMSEGVEGIRALHLDRLDQMLAGVWDRAPEGDPPAIGAALKIMKKIEDLMGIVPARRLEHVSPDGSMTTPPTRIEIVDAGGDS